MDNLTTVVIIKKSSEIISFYAKLTSPNEFLFSKELLLGNVDKAIDNYIEQSEEFTKLKPMYLAPTDAGLTVIDFKNKMLLSLNHFIQPGKINLSDFQEKIIVPYYNITDTEQMAKFNEYFEKNKVSFFNYKTQQTLTSLELFNTNDSLKIIDLINNTKMAKHEGNMNARDKSKAFSMHLLTPSSLNLNIKQYKYDELENFYIDLSKNIKLSEQDTHAWYYFLDNNNQSESKIKIQNYVNAITEKESLEKLIKHDSTNISSKIKL
jgi:hypothetical protein